MSDVKNKAKSAIRPPKTEATHADDLVRDAAQGTKAGQVAPAAEEEWYDADEIATISKALVAKIKHDRPHK